MIHLDIGPLRRVHRSKQLNTEDRFWPAAARVKRLLLDLFGQSATAFGASVSSASRGSYACSCGPIRLPIASISIASVTPLGVHRCAEWAARILFVRQGRRRFTVGAKRQRLRGHSQVQSAHLLPLTPLHRGTKRPPGSAGYAYDKLCWQPQNPRLLARPTRNSLHHHLGRH
jgi:hypothetical protein